MEHYEAFEAWLEEDMYPSEITRRQFIEKHSKNMDDIEWAFISGWTAKRWKEVSNSPEFNKPTQLDLPF